MGNSQTLELKIGEIVDTLGVHSKPMAIRELQTRVKGGNTIICAAVLECEKRGFIKHPEGRAHGWVLTDLGKRFFSGNKSVNNAG